MQSVSQIIKILKRLHFLTFCDMIMLSNKRKNLLYIGGNNEERTTCFTTCCGICTYLWD